MNRMIVVGLMAAMTALLACNKGNGDSSAGAAATGGDSIGVKECDDYMKTWNDCYKDPAAKAAAKPGLDAMTKAWKEQAKDPASKSALAQACKMALDNFPKASCH